MENEEYFGHILIFPLPAQGHVNSMLKFAQLLDLSGFHVTFLVTADVLARLQAHTDVESGRFSNRFRFQTFPTGIYEGKVDNMEKLIDLCESLYRVGKPFLREFIAKQNKESKLPFTCFISDLLISIAFDVCEDFGLPVYYFRTISSCAFWAFFSMPDLVDSGELPVKDDGMDSPITKVKGMEHFLRARDLPSACHIINEKLNFVYNETQSGIQARAIIFNTFEDLEGAILSQIRTKCPKVYSIGPINALLKDKLASNLTSSNSLWQEDKTCMTWLDSQEPKSVIYVSFGSITVITRNQLMEFWYGLVNSGKKFLWVIRSDLISAEGDVEKSIPSDLEDGTKANGYLVAWAPQEIVLEHQAVGVFLTHSGWNSTLESIVAGVPMICWPFFGDQQLNSRFVGEVWKLGLDMKDVCDRDTIESLIRELMDNRKNEYLERAESMAKLAKKAITKGGSSYQNFDCLIQDIKSMK